MTFLKTKKYLVGAAALALASASGACAQSQEFPTPVATTTVAAAAAEVDAPALWKIADEDTTIYVFGTVHALPADIEWYTGPVQAALDESDTLVTEIDMTAEAMAAVPAIVQQTAMLPAGTTVRSLLTDEQRSTYEAALTELGIPVNALDPLEPWFANLQITQFAFAQAGITGENGTETVLEEIIGDTKGRGALETVPFQLSIFDELPQDVQINYLMETVENLDELAPMLQSIIDEWAEGDVDGLGDLMNEALESDPVLAERLLYARNANWAEWIDNRLDEPGTIFMAVGAGHMAGNKKLQDWLAQRDIVMTRIQ